MEQNKTFSREEFLALQDDAARTFDSKRWGCSILFRQATVADKAVARQRAMVTGSDGKPVIDNERLEAALVVRCCIEPRFEPQDLDALMNKNGNEVSRLASEILGNTANPR